MKRNLMIALIALMAILPAAKPASAHDGQRCSWTDMAVHIESGQEVSGFVLTPGMAWQTGAQPAAVAHYTFPAGGVVFDGRRYPETRYGQEIRPGLVFFTGYKGNIEVAFYSANGADFEVTVLGPGCAKLYA